MAGGAAEGTATAVAAGSAGLSARASTTGAESAGELSAFFFFLGPGVSALEMGVSCWGLVLKGCALPTPKSHTPHLLMLGFFVGASLCADGGVSCWRWGVRMGICGLVAAPKVAMLLPLDCANMRACSRRTCRRVTSLVLLLARVYTAVSRDDFHTPSGDVAGI